MTTWTPNDDGRLSCQLEHPRKDDIPYGGLTGSHQGMLTLLVRVEP